MPVAVLKKLFPVSDGPYTTTVAGSTRVTQQFDSIKLQCCGECNDTLARRFENPGQAAAHRLFSQEAPALSAPEAQAAALWVLKTWLLMAHPDARYQLGTPRPQPWDAAPEGTWSWLVDSRPPPDGLSVWAFRYLQDARAASADSLTLPTVAADGRTVRFRALDLTLSLTNVVLVLHPGWSLDHPAEATGEVVRLWPRDPLPLPALPARGSRPVRFADGPELRFGPGMFRPPLPALRAGTPPEALVFDLLDGGHWR